ncbi:hypothetical protein P8452_68238 [Trifolium repens]|nr:hypothetical protein P8452_68238 [Trifolium repens]
MAMYNTPYVDMSDAAADEIINTPTLSFGISRTFRSVPPAHYLFKVQPYSSLTAVKVILGKVESTDFKAGGYTWRLILHPGNLEGPGKGHISLYLTIVNTDKFSHGWEVNVNFKLFVFDQRKNHYMTVQDDDGAVSTFSKNQTECGFDQLIPEKDLYDSTNGYLVQGLCVFGAEVFVIGKSNKWGSLSVIKDPPHILTFKLDNFSTLLDKSVSKSIIVSQREWKLDVFPKGINREGIRGRYLSANLVITDCEQLPSNKTTVYDLVKKGFGQLNQEDHEKTMIMPMSTTTDYGGFLEFISLSELNEAENGYIKDDAIIIELQILNVFMVKISS